MSGNTNIKLIPAILAFIVGIILLFAGGVSAMSTTIPGLIFIAISLGIDGSFVKAWKELR